MKALIAFIGMAVVILVLIEINERIKAKKNRDLETSKPRDPENCKKEQSESENCSDCSLIDICEKKSTAVR